MWLTGSTSQRTNLRWRENTLCRSRGGSYATCARHCRLWWDEPLQARPHWQDKTELYGGEHDAAPIPGGTRPPSRNPRPPQVSWIISLAKLSTFLESRIYYIFNYINLGGANGNVIIVICSTVISAKASNDVKSVAARNRLVNWNIRAVKAIATIRSIQPNHPHTPHSALLSHVATTLTT